MNPWERASGLSRFLAWQILKGRVVLHVGTLASTEIETRHGFQLTTLERTLLDLAGEGRHADALAQAIQVAAAQGAISAATATRLEEMTGGDRE